jgi:putative ABC transport system permease protein
LKFNRLIVNSLWHYRRRNLTVALGMAIGMAVITGALVTGDSVKGGLQNLVGVRLGNADLAVSAGDRYLTDSLSVRMSADLGIPATAILQLGGSATAGGGSIRMPKVQVYGVGESLATVLGPETFEPPVNSGEVIISDNLAARLDVTEGDEILLRINKPGPVPIDAPFVSDEESMVTAAVIVKEIAGKARYGRFNLLKTQTAPFNIFINKKQLQDLAGLEGLSNLILLAGDGAISGSRVESSLADNRTLADAGIHIDLHPGTGEPVLRTPRVFFDLPSLDAITGLPDNKNLYFSYFINEFRSGSRSTPYSFVSTLPDDQVNPGEMIINRWLADDLGVEPGDSVTISYFMVGPLRNLTTDHAQFLITGILSMDDDRCDPLLMPEIPGLSDAGNCRDWETSIPIELDKIRDKDEDYWNKFRGTPKAFIHAGMAAEMWQNRFGKYTQVRLEPGTSIDAISAGILARLRPADTGITVSEPAREGLLAASTGVDFSGLFFGLSFFLIAGGVILTILLIRLGLEGRLSQIGSLRAMGWPEKRIRQLLLAENGLVAIIGTLIGLALTILYSILIFKALNGIWNTIVLTDGLRPIFRPTTLALGFVISVFVSGGTAWLALNRFFHRKPVELLRHGKKGPSKVMKLLLTISAAGTGISALAMLTRGIMRMNDVSPTFFFGAGTLMLICLLLIAIRIFRYYSPGTRNNFGLAALCQSSLWRNSTRSLSVILLFAIGVFMVMAIGANRKTVPAIDKESGAARYAAKTGGTGGYLYFMETTVPVPDNLNDPAVRAKYGLEVPSGFVQMKKLEGDDASCLNLNRVSNPPLLGVPGGAFSERFSFAALGNEKFRDDPWGVLDSILPGGAIPAIADQTVIQWGLGLKIGDTLRYLSENGDTLDMVLVGGLANSIFQGNVLISENNFIRNWPSAGGTRISMVEAESQALQAVSEDLRRVFRDYGIDLNLTTEKLAEFNSIENTYLSIFLVMGALAMLLGTIGLGIILTRNLQERRAEIALLRAVGFSRRRILLLVVSEYLVLLIFGTLAGGLASIISVLPGLVGPSGEVSPLFLISILLILVVNGLFWILILGWNSVRKPDLIRSLATE